MAQVNLKDRIREMRLRVLAEPLGEAAIQVAEKNSIETRIDQALNKPISEEEIINENSARKKSKRTKKVGNKTISKTKHKQLNKKTEKIEEDSFLSGELSTPDDSESNSPENENLSTEESTRTENKNETDGIVDLTDKWVELEVRSRLSGLEQQEKQTRAMLREIVEVLDRIETLEYVKPNEQSPALPVIQPNKKVSKLKKLSWSEIVKRIFVVLGTFLILTGIIWAILFYLFF